MSTVATIRSSAGSGVIRPLQPSEHHLLREHLLRLDPASRYDRFNGGISDAFIGAYAARCVERGAFVIAYLQDGVVRAAAELHPAERSSESTPELAFSVEDRLRRQGVGSALFEQILAEARRRGYPRVRITTGGQNHAMKALAFKFGANLVFASGETTGTIDLPRSKASGRPQSHDTTVGQLAAAPWRVPLASLSVARDVARVSQTMWGQLFRTLAELLKLRPLLGLR